MEGREISKAVITRLPRYYRYLGELLESGVERISSNELRGAFYSVIAAIGIYYRDISQPIFGI